MISRRANQQQDARCISSPAAITENADPQTLVGKRPIRDPPLRRKRVNAIRAQGLGDTPWRVRSITSLRPSSCRRACLSVPAMPTW
ncbi:hypothetical protein KCP73_14380 [Salmonella enterica subsp. enterica]|nr:hypothetical protein KCP73_14380 [Salmonella enterica subsp. enterica]